MKHLYYYWAAADVIIASYFMLDLSHVVDAYVWYAVSYRYDHHPRTSTKDRRRHAPSVSISINIDDDQLLLSAAETHLQTVPATLSFNNAGENDPKWTHHPLEYLELILCS